MKNTPEADAHLLAFNNLLAELLNAGPIIPCVGRREWIAADPESVTLAKAGCLDCPAIEECRETAVAIQADGGVWAGINCTKSRWWRLKRHPITSPKEEAA